MSLDQLLAWIPPGSPDLELARQIQSDRLPQHVAIIMDGNGRWAGRRRLPRVEGHRAGIQSVREVLETSARLGLQVLTHLYSRRLLLARRHYGHVPAFCQACAHSGQVAHLGLGVRQLGRRR